MNMDVTQASIAQSRIKELEDALRSIKAHAETMTLDRSGPCDYDEEFANALQRISEIAKGVLR